MANSERRRAVHQLRKILGDNQTKFGERIGVDQSTVSKWESSKQDINDDHWRGIVRLLREHKEHAHLDVGQGALLTIGELHQEVRVDSRVGVGEEVFALNKEAGDEIRVIEVPAAFGDVVAVEVVGHSMFPAHQDGDVLLFTKHEGGFEGLLGGECLILTAEGQSFVKVLEIGSSIGRFNLASYNVPTIIRDVVVVSAAPLAFTDHKKRRRR